MCLGCAVPFPRASVASHAREASHLVFADADRAELFCAACDSHAYAPAFDRAVLGARAIRAGITGDVPPTRAASRPSDDDDDDDASPPPLPKLDRTRRRRRRSPSPLNASGVPRGVRGVANLGATCFMSSVLQAITRDPICARFFLSDGHDAARCAERRATRALDAHRDGLQVRPEDDHCLACELDALINAAFADGDVEAQKEPLVPAAFLHAWWRHAPEHLARYGQQDAHEFFLALAQAIHAAAVGPEESEKRTSEEGARVGGVPTINDAREENDDAKRGEVGGEANASAAGPGGVSAGAAGGAAAKEWRIPGNDATERTKSPRARPDGVGRAPPGGVVSSLSSCRCPMHRAFGGTLRSDVTCGACGHVSVAHDPTVGLSLDLPTTTRGPGPGVTLEACLRLMTRPERLGAGEAFACAACGDAEGAKWKQMAIRETPRTLALQLKRFARSSFRPGKLPVQADSDANAANVANASNASNARGAANKSTATKGGKQNKGADAASAGGSKIETHVSFPFTLDIAPFRASAALRARYGNRAPFEAPGNEDGPEGPERSVDASGTASGGASGPARPKEPYELFAVVVHAGGMDSGHYVAYARWQDAWFRCDDHRISRADPVAVAAAQAYLLFYERVDDDEGDDDRS